LTILDNNQDNIPTPYFLGPLGIIHVLYKLIGLWDLVDSALPEIREHKVSNSECLLCLLLFSFTINWRGLSNISHQMRLYPLELLFGRDIDPDCFNDDVLARFLEAINDYGPEEFYTRFIQHISNKTKNLIEFDKLIGNITDYSVYGQYDRVPEDEGVQISVGSFNDKRDHLKLFSLFILKNYKGLPIGMKQLPENISDVKELGVLMSQTLKSVIKGLNLPQKPYFIGNAAFYKQNNFADFGANWIARVTETIKEANELIYSQRTLEPVSGDNNYSFHQVTLNYAGIEQNWFLIHSAIMDNREGQALEKRLKKTLLAGRAALKKLVKEPFESGEDAKSHAEKWVKKQPYLRFSRLEIKAKGHVVNDKPDRPKDDIPRKNYFIAAEVVLDDEMVARERRALGRFILATNDLTLTPYNILKYYMEQSQIEKGFSLLKGRDFRVSEVLLDNSFRIQGFSCVMTIILFFNALLEYKLRSGLEQNNQFLLNIANKPLKKPTIRNILIDFDSIILAVFRDKNNNLKQSISLSKRQFNQFNIVLRALGQEFEDFYKDFLVSLR
jgi:transposase